METVDEVNIIELRQIPVIEERLKAVRDDVLKVTSEATSLICTEDNYKDIKKVRADLTKRFKAVEEQRKAVKAAIMAPYEAFEKVYRECITDPFSKADFDLKAKINIVEDGLKAQKTSELYDYYDELVFASGVEWLADMPYEPDVTMSVSLKKLKEDAKAYVERIIADVETIDSLNNSAEVTVEYKKTLNLAAAISAVNARRAAVEEQTRSEEEARRIREERREAEAATMAAVPEPVAAVPQVIAENATEFEESDTAKDPVYEVRFFVRGTRDQLKAMKAYFEKEGLIYGSL